MTKKSKMILGLASLLGVSAGASAVSGFAWFITTKSATVNINNIGVYSTSSNLNVVLKQALKGCTDDAADPSTQSDINLVGGTSAKTETFKATASQATLALKHYAKEITSVSKNGTPLAVSTDYTWTAGTTGKTITLTNPAAANDEFEVSYVAYAALTDVSSADGKTFYKPVWTAAGAGVTATSITDVTDAASGYVSFSMTLTAAGTDNLDIYLNQPTITAVNTSDAADTAAANITRVSFIDNNVTKLIVQKGTIGATNNKGIDSLFAATPNASPLWDLSTLSTGPSNTIFANLDGTDKDTMSAGTKTAGENYVTTVTGGTSKDIIVNIWLEGTSGNQSGNAGGQFATAANPENGMINVNLPLIAFNA
jgi:hypothetical protein